MKKLKKLSVLLLAAMMIFTMLATPVSAASYGDVIIATPTLNVRSTAGGNKVVGSVHQGETYHVYEYTGSWARIGTNRWVSTDYAKVIGDAGRCNYQWSRLYTPNNARINIRCAPSTKCSSITTVSSNRSAYNWLIMASTSKTASESSSVSGWCHVTNGNVSGWVCMNYVHP